MLALIIRLVSTYLGIAGLLAVVPAFIRVGAFSVTIYSLFAG